MGRIAKLIERSLAVLAGLALLVMMVLTFVDVVGRYGFNRSVFGTSEIIEFLMVSVIFAGIAFVTADDEHIKVEIFEPWIKKRAEGLQRWSVLVVSTLIYLALTIELLRHALDSLHSGKRTAVLDLPQWIMPAAAAAFSILGVVLMVVVIFITKGRPGRFGSSDHSEGR